MQLIDYESFGHGAIAFRTNYFGHIPLHLSAIYGLELNKEPASQNKDARLRAGSPGRPDVLHVWRNGNILV